MKHLFWPVLGLILGFIVSACATSFPYTSYGVALKDAISDSTLLAAIGSNKPDLPLSDCAATPNDASPCIAFMQADYLAFKADYLNTKQELENCQKSLR